MSHADNSAIRSSLSFELFPPKDRAGIDRLISGTVTRLAAFRPDYFSVTFGAGGATERAQALVEKLVRSGTKAVPHLSAAGSTNAEVDRLVERYRNLGFSKSSACGETDLPAATIAPSLRKISSSSCTNAFPANSS